MWKLNYFYPISVKVLFMDTAPWDWTWVWYMALYIQMLFYVNLALTTILWWLPQTGQGNGKILIEQFLSVYHINNEHE